MEGYFIQTGAGRFEIAEACAGLNFVLAAIMVASVYAYLSFSTWRGRSTFFVFAVIVAFAANLLRAYALIAIATISDMQLAVGPDHVLMGLVFYGLVFAILLLTGERFATRKTAEQPAGVANVDDDDWTARYVTLSLIVVATVGVYAALIVNRPIATASPPPLSLISAPGWRILPPPENWRGAYPNADRIANATYADNKILFTCRRAIFPTIDATLKSSTTRTEPGTAPIGAK